MTVKDLIELLSTFDPSLEVINTRYSDYEFMERSDVYMVKAVNRPGRYLMRVYDRQIPSMAPEDVAAIREYLHFEGN